MTEMCVTTSTSCIRINLDKKAPKLALLGFLRPLSLMSLRVVEGAPDR